jgi:hypothetical protein
MASDVPLKTAYSDSASVTLMLCLFATSLQTAELDSGRAANALAGQEDGIDQTPIAEFPSL